mgnify:CR=1 FL=1
MEDKELIKFVKKKKKKNKLGHYDSIWEIANGESEMIARCEKLVKKFKCDYDDILVFDMDSQW